MEMSGSIYRNVSSTFAVLGGLLLATSVSAAPSVADRPHPLNTPAAGRPVAAAAPDQQLGTAVLAARVQSDGSLLAGSGATGVIKISTGIYEVDFNRNVSNCFYNAVSFSSTVATTVQPRFSNVNGAFLVFKTIDGMQTATDSQFYMTIYCGQ